MAACVALAHEVGSAVAERFGIPVFLYEEAASSPGRRNLEDIRRGEFEGLAGKMQKPEWAPDYGPATPHASAGGSVVGARMPLIAQNAIQFVLPALFMALLLELASRATLLVVAVAAASTLLALLALPAYQAIPIGMVAGALSMSWRRPQSA